VTSPTGEEEGEQEAPAMNTRARSRSRSRVRTPGPPPPIASMSAKPGRAGGPRAKSARPKGGKVKSAKMVEDSDENGEVQSNQPVEEESVGPKKRRKVA
jgi:hypothetical protein